MLFALRAEFTTLALLVEVQCNATTTHGQTQTLHSINPREVAEHSLTAHCPLDWTGIAQTLLHAQYKGQK